MKSIKVGAIKWLPTGSGIIGLGILLFVISNDSRVVMGTAVVAAISLGFQIFGEARHAQAMASKAELNPMQH